jgi:hypothetical protein
MPRPTTYSRALTPNPEKTFGSGQGVYKEQKISLIGKNFLLLDEKWYRQTMV